MMTMERWRVHKFGGSSVADAACMERVARILEDDPRRRVAAVLSACRGVTDALLALVTAAERQEDGDAGRLEAVRQRHIVIANTLLGTADATEYGQELGRDCDDIAGILQTVRLVRLASAVVRDLVAGFGEIWSTRLFARYLRGRNRRPGGVHWIDAREIVRIDTAPLGPSILGPSREPTRTASSPRIRTRRSSSPASSRGRATDCRPPSAGTAATSPGRSSARCSTRPTS